VAAATAQELGVYDRLAEGAAPVAELAEDLSLSRRGLSILLPALEEMGLVRTEPGRGWRLSGEARGLFVDPDTPDYHADALRHWLGHVRDWSLNLPEGIRKGAPPEGDGEGHGEPDADEEDDAGSDAEDAGGAGAGASGPPDEEGELERFMAAMASKSPDLVRSVVDAALERAPRAPVPGPARALDLGGGPGTFSRELAGRGLEVVLFDRPEVIEHVRPAYGLDRVEGLTLRSGDFLEELPEGPFQVILAANITHIYDPATNAGLLARLAARLSGGGVLAIMDFVRGVEPFAALFAITMLMNTERGNTYSLPTYQRWLEAAGLESVRSRTVLEDRQVVTAVRP